MTSVGVRELSHHTSRYLARAKAGQSLGITERGRLIAVITPAVRDDQRRRPKPKVGGYRSQKPLTGEEIGSGKSLLAHAVLGLLPSNAVQGGTIAYAGAPPVHRRLRRLRGREIALIPQSVRYLDPLARVGPQTRRAAALVASPDPAAATTQAYARLDLPAGTERAYPHELSGGMARRVLTATSTIGRPRLVIADEPTPGLHAATVTETLRGCGATAVPARPRRDACSPATSRPAAGPCGPTARRSRRPGPRSVQLGFQHPEAAVDPRWRLARRRRPSRRLPRCDGAGPRRRLPAAATA
jgi:antitoxin (DNA-binding transcriptional repressor) of toxin-antitoxin stability system